MAAEEVSEFCFSWLRYTSKQHTSYVHCTADFEQQLGSGIPRKAFVSKLIVVECVIVIENAQLVVRCSVLVVQKLR
jgi:hypothetical protein